VSFNPVSLSSLDLQTILKEGEHNSLICNLLFVQIFADTIEEAIEDHLKSVKF